MRPGSSRPPPMQTARAAAKCRPPHAAAGRRYGQSDFGEPSAPCDRTECTVRPSCSRRPKRRRAASRSLRNAAFPAPGERRPPRIHRKADRPDCARTVPPHARKKRKSRYPTLRVSARSPIPVRQRVSFCAPTSRSGRSLRPTRNIRRGSRPADGPVRDRNGRRGRCSVRRPAR